MDRRYSLQEELHLTNEVENMGNKKRTVLITGGGTDLAKEVCLRLASEGMNVGVADSDYERAKEITDMIKEAGGEAMPFLVDVSDEKSVEEMFNGFLAAYGKINYFMASDIKHRHLDFLKITYEDWKNVMSTNICGTILCCRRAAKEMIKQGKGEGPYSILLAAPDEACSQNGNAVADCASSWGLRGFMRSMALNLAPEDITVNLMAPEENDKAAIKETAEIARFVFSDEARNVTGITIMDNGGNIMT